jgi:hypothetical protein
MLLDPIPTPPGSGGQSDWGLKGLWRRFGLGSGARGQRGGEDWIV